MNGKTRTLQAEIRRDLSEIAQAYEKLRPYTEQPLEGDTAIVVAYYFHVIYGLFENLFVRVATYFGTPIRQTDQWHVQLLKQMGLEIEGIRPALLRPETSDCLDELRRFRHVFRNAYVLHFDPVRLELALRDGQRLEHLYPADIEAFLTFLDTLIEP